MSFMSWHFEGRHARNVRPTVDVKDMEADGWEKLDPPMARYHQDPDATVELKFVKPDKSSFLGLGGYEAVWDEDTGAWLEAGAYGSTYNYVMPGGIVRNIGHALFDVVPYWFLGTDRGKKHKPFLERVTGRHRG